MTHSLEVAQIAKSIAVRLNVQTLGEQGCPLDSDLVEFAGLAHDLGHPPFGHTGEDALNQIIIERTGGTEGFEGNAQTLRLLSRLEKKLDDPSKQLFQSGRRKNRPRWYNSKGQDSACGLNLCARSLAAVLKYDREIHHEGAPTAGKAKVEKGYYPSEAAVVSRIRKDVGWSGSAMKTLECQIMDIADDIAYSTYDLEDALKGEILRPLDILFPEDEVLEEVARRTTDELGTVQGLGELDGSQVSQIILSTFHGNFLGLDSKKTTGPQALGSAHWLAETCARSGFFRSQLTSPLVGRAVDAVRIIFNDGCPKASRVEVEAEERLRISVLKHLVYVLLINSNRLKIVAFRGGKIIREIFDSLADEHGFQLLPADFREQLDQTRTDGQRVRVICDFIAGMTDRYAVEFFARLTSENYQTIFKPF